MFFGDRFKTGDFELHSAAIPVAREAGFAEIFEIARRASITIVIP